jgi:phosphatidylglycerophosphatase A
MIFVSIFASGLVVRQVGVDDPRYIVSDEWAGMWLALWPTRHYVIEALNGGSWLIGFASMLSAFLLFRLFDIWKPWPVRKLESLPGGWGITMDDVAAGILAGLVLYCGHAFI